MMKQMKLTSPPFEEYKVAEPDHQKMDPNGDNPSLGYKFTFVDFNDPEMMSIIAFKVNQTMLSLQWKGLRDDISEHICSSSNFSIRIETLFQWYGFSKASGMSLIPKLILSTFGKIDKIRKDEFRALLLDHWEKIDRNDLPLFLETFPIKANIVEIAENIIKKKYPKLNMHNTSEVINSLLIKEEDELAFQYALVSVERQKALIETLIENKKNGLALKYSKIYNFDIRPYSILLNLIKIQTLKYYIKDNEPWYLVEDKLRNDPGLLQNYMKKHYDTKQMGNEIFSILKRNHLSDRQPKKYIENPLYKNDKFAPTEEILEICPPGTFLNLQNIGYDQPPQWIDKLTDEVCNEIWTRVTDHKILAFDGEWVSFMYSYGEPGLSILQLATIGVTYIFDVHKLKAQAKFYNLIKGLFAAENILKVGHTIKSDIDMINHSFKEQDIKIQVKSCIDLAIYCKTTLKLSRISLKVIVDTYLDRPLSKLEQVSNWNHRPLRQAQLHYAGLDAAVLIALFNKIGQNGTMPGLITYPELDEEEEKFFKEDPSELNYEEEFEHIKLN